MKPGDRVRAVRFAVSKAGTPDEHGLIRNDAGEVVTIDDNVTVPPGTEGVVDHIDDVGTVHVQWDNGHHIGLLPGYDAWEEVK